MKPAELDPPEIRARAARRAGEHKVKQDADWSANAPLDPWGSTARRTGAPAKKQKKTAVAASKAPPKQKAVAQKTAPSGDAMKKPPYDVASKVVPIRFKIVNPPEKKGIDDTADALSGKSARKFAKYIAHLASATPAVTMRQEEQDQQVEAGGKLDNEIQGQSYMEAYDAEKRKIKEEDAERAARAEAQTLAVRVRAHALVIEQKNRAIRAVQNIKAAEAKMSSAEKGVKVATSAVNKGWLKPKVAAEMALAQKDTLRKAEAGVKKAKMHERRLKRRNASKQARKFSAEKLAAKKLALQGKKEAAAAVDKELAMKFVQKEFERRKKVAHLERVRKVELDKKMKASAELIVKKEVSEESREKAAENLQKGKANEKSSKQKAGEQQQKLALKVKMPRSTNCAMGAWMPWSQCSRPCAGGMQARSRQVRTPPSADGAPCAALTQSRPCNMQPCLSKTFGIGYCDRALKGCTKYRALEHGCHTPAQVYGKGTGITKIMLDEHAKMERKIATITNKKKDPKGWLSAEKPEKFSDRPADKIDKAVTREHKAAIEHVHRAAEGKNKPTVRFEFSHAKRTAAAAMSFNLKKDLPMSPRSTSELGESDEVAAKPAASQKTQQVSQQSLDSTNSPVKPQLKLDKMSAKEKSRAARCARYKNAVAHFCGRMVDCVTKNVDKQDIHYSQALQRQARLSLPPGVEAAAAAQKPKQSLPKALQGRLAAPAPAPAPAPAKKMSVEQKKTLEKQLETLSVTPAAGRLKVVKARNTNGGTELLPGAGLFKADHKAQA